MIRGRKDDNMEGAISHKGVQEKPKVTKAFDSDGESSDVYTSRIRGRRNTRGRRLDSESSEHS